MSQKKRILFMCVANSSRSQIAEGLARQIFKEEAEIQSAGSQPSQVNALAVEVMKEVGIDLSSHYSKSVEELSPRFLTDLNYLITLCAEEVCPILVSKAQRIHWPLPDPSANPELCHDEKSKLFRETREKLRQKLMEFKERIEK